MPATLVEKIIARASGAESRPLVCPSAARSRFPDPRELRGIRTLEGLSTSWWTLKNH